MSPDIFIAKNKKKPEDSPQSAKKADEPVVLKSEPVKDKIKEGLKKESSETILAKIQAEINHILKDKPQNGFTASFLGKPPTIRFETQDKEEKIIALLRQHWVVNVGWILLAFVLVLVMPFLKYLPVVSWLPANYQLILALTYFLFIYYFVTERLLKWFYNVYIITDERFVDVDFVSLLYKRISGAKIDSIQDVTYDMSGLVEAFFNYGTVRIQTASEIPTFEFENVPKPQAIVSLLNQLMMEEELEKIEGRIR
jgi:membrane protein YdbS with pleckstrin-like domain